MKQRLTAALLAVLLLLSLLSGCSGGDEPEVSSGGLTAAQNDYPVTIGDLTLSAAPEKVVVLSPSIADIILAAGMEIELAGRSEECTQADLSVLPVMGSSTGVDVEAIKALGAGLVLCDAALSEEDSAALSEAGIPVLVLAPAATREEFERLYSDVGSALSGGKTGFEQAVKTARGIFSTLDQIEMVIPARDVPVTACYLFSVGTAATGDTLAGKLFDYAGAINTAYDSPDGVFSTEQLILSDPQYIFCAPGVKEELLANEDIAAAGLTAVAEDRIYEMDPALMTRQGRSVTEAVVFMAGVMYPELAGESEPSEEDPSSQGTGSQTEETPASSSEPPASSNSPSATGTLQLGDEGEEVRRMQERLDELGYMLYPISGEFGAGTKQCLQNFELYNGLIVDGIADQATLDKLYSDTARSNPDA